MVRSVKTEAGNGGTACPSEVRKTVVCNADACHGDRIAEDKTKSNRAMIGGAVGGVAGGLVLLAGVYFLCKPSPAPPAAAETSARTHEIISAPMKPLDHGAKLHQTV